MYKHKARIAWENLIELRNIYMHSWIGKFYKIQRIRDSLNNNPPSSFDEKFLREYEERIISYLLSRNLPGIYYGLTFFFIKCTVFEIIVYKANIIYKNQNIKFSHKWLMTVIYMEWNGFIIRYTENPISISFLSIDSHMFFCFNIYEQY